MNIKEELKKIEPLHKGIRKVKDSFKYFNNVYIDELKFYTQLSLKKLGIIKLDPDICALKDKHKGEKILVLSTGPSLTYDDLDKIEKSGFTTISVNGIFKAFGHTSFRPDYYLIDDYWLFYQYAKQFPDLKEDQIAKKWSIFTNQAKRFIPNWKEMKNTSFVAMNYFDHWENLYSKKYKYSDDFRYGIYDFYTCTNSSILLAKYMGAAEIYLVGTDCNYSVAFNHIGEGEGVKIAQGKDFENCQTHSYELVKNYIGDEVKIYNATRGGMLEVFPRANLDEVLESNKYA